MRYLGAWCHNLFDGSSDDGVTESLLIVSWQVWWRQSVPAPTVAVCSGTAQIVSGSVFSQSRTSLVVNDVSLFRDSSDMLVFSQSRTSLVVNGVSLFRDSSD